MLRCDPCFGATRASAQPGLLCVVAGIGLAQCAKAWYLDRMVLLFEDMKARNPTYAA